MKGVVLAGGLGTRLRPLTAVTNKHLLPVYDRPMLFWPLQMLAEAGIQDVLLVLGGQSTEEIMKLCKNGKQWGFRSLCYAFQEGEGGIADALSLAETFVGKDDCCVVLGDNIMLGDSLKEYVMAFRGTSEYGNFGVGAMVLAAEVQDPQNYGVPTVEHDGKRILYITEKPKIPESRYGIIGVYFYDATVFDRIRKCSKSERGELEITDVNNLYAQESRLTWKKVKGTWLDAGSSIEAWLRVGKAVEEHLKKEEYHELVRKG